MSMHIKRELVIIGLTDLGLIYLHFISQSIIANIVTIYLIPIVISSQLIWIYKYIRNRKYGQRKSA